LLIIYEDTVATCSKSRAGLLSHAKPIQARLSGDSTQMSTHPRLYINKQKRVRFLLDLPMRVIVVALPILEMEENFPLALRMRELLTSAS